MRLLIFSEFQEHTNPIFRNFTILKLKDIIKFNILNLMYLYYNDQLPLKIKYIFTANEHVNAYNTRDRKLLFIPQVNTTRCGTMVLLFWIMLFSTARKMKFSIKDFFSKCDQIRSFLRIWLHLPKKLSVENFIFCAVQNIDNNNNLCNTGISKIQKLFKEHFHQSI